MYLYKDQNGLYSFWCPACQRSHQIDGKWTIDLSDPEKPTVRPSIKPMYTRLPKGKLKYDQSGNVMEAIDVVCHLFITNGMIQYLKDCTHQMAGSTVPMEEI